MTLLSNMVLIACRLRMLGCSANKDKDMILQEEEGDKTEVNFKFRFPPFEQAGGNSEIKNRKFECASVKTPVSAFIEVLKTFPVREINGDKINSFSSKKVLKFDDENVKIETIEFQENEVEEEFVDFCSEKKSDGFLNDGDFIEDLVINGEESDVKEKNTLSSDFLSENDFIEDSDKKNDATFVAKDGKGEDILEKMRQNDESSRMDSNKLESLWEHQELIEQLQMELKKAKATGLPTIFEESESPKINIDDLKPWKIDHKIRREDELHKFYKSYSEMMRKFDIFNYQKMYAMGIYFSYLYLINIH